MSNDVYDAQWDKAGFYTLQGEIFDRMYWVQTDGTNAIMYYPKFGWYIGPELDPGDSFAGIYANTTEVEFPYDERNTWKYWDDDDYNWKDTDDVKIIC